jgi:hypothetical protein
MQQGQRHTSRRWLRQARRHARWRIHGQRDWLPLGTQVALGAGYRQTVQLAVTCRGCDEQGCQQGIAVGDAYVVSWRGHSRVTLCVGHAPLPVEIWLPQASGRPPVAARHSLLQDAGQG